jgi:cysteine synthase A
MYDEVRVVNEEHGRAMARRIAKEEGVFAGTSSGVNLVAALELAREWVLAKSSRRWPLIRA